MFKRPFFLLGLAFLGWINSVPAWAVHAQKKCDLEFKKLKICGTLHWARAPRVVEMITPQDAAELTVDLQSRDSKAHLENQNLELSVKPTMPSMGGHGTEPTRVTRVSQKTGVVEFQVQEVYLSMPGDWLFTFKLKKEGKELDQAQWSYQLK